MLGRLLCVSTALSQTHTRSLHEHRGAEMADEHSNKAAGLYDFDAPSHVVDFQQLQDEPCDDSWFDQQALEQNVHAVQLFKPDEGPSKPKATVGPMSVADSGAADTNTPCSGGAIPKTSGQALRVPKRKGQAASSSPSQPLKKYKKSPVLQSTGKSTLTQPRRMRPRTRSAFCAKPTTGTKDQEEEEEEEVDQDCEREPEAPSLRKKKEATLSSKRPHLTVPRPLNLGAKRKPAKDPYVPTAQRIMQLQQRTPQRFHQLSRQAIEKGPPKAKGQRLQLTRPQSPNFSTRLRSRPPAVKSSAQLEEEELLKFNFKAVELNKKILEQQESLKKPVAKASTVQEAFTMHIEKRLQERQVGKAHEEEKEAQPAFKAHDLPKKILEGVVGVPDRKVIQPTVPQSPAFILAKRARPDIKNEEVKAPSPIKHVPVPHFGVTFHPILPEKQHIQVCPFSFEQREQAKKQQKESREQKEEELPAFKAQPLPHFDTVVLPERKKLEPTKPEPFRLLVDQRGSVKNERWEQMVKEEQKKMKEATTFKARPNKITLKEPFQPKKEDRTSVEVEAFQLATERRARERDDFQQMLSQKEALCALMEEQQRRQEEDKQKMEVTKLRQEQVHKAQRIRHYKTVEVKKSEAALTVPKSPNFSDRFRL
ncbi:targeting protein for Xklp2-like isoform X1 [Nerophis ophidion]|uniref:targeting protein for Xklp2-like isoform X1 n=1 Tax=Nerophis ophidion TaxID=159077 RepID=UPI002AE07F3D|nr:targeting protein for Xklp2-like isoform X1 [Nerophis ophidion]